MENLNQNQPEEEEIPNIDQFQVGRSQTDDLDEQEDDTGYTEDEMEYADGVGTRLNEEIDGPEGDDEIDPDEDDLGDLDDDELDEDDNYEGPVI